MKIKNLSILPYLLTLLALLSTLFANSQISENFQSWTSRGGYSSFTQAGSGGNWTAVSTIVAPSGAASGTGSIGYCQLQSANGILTLPNIASGGVGTVTIRARVSGANGGFSLQKNVDSGGWTNVQTYTSSSTTGVNFTATVNDGSANIQLRINNTGGSGGRALYIHDVITTVVSFPPPVVSSSSTSGSVGTAFSFDLSTLATNSPTSYAITGGALPAGLSLNTSTGDITGTPTTAGSYSITFTATNTGGTSSPAATLSITINKGNQTITFNTPGAVTYGAAPGTLSATASSGLAVSFSSATPTVATVSGTTITYTGAGSSAITATQAGNANWNAATAVIRTQVVNPKALTVSGLSGVSKVYDATTTTTATGSALLNGVLAGDIGNVSLSGSPVFNFTNANVGTNKPITVTGYTLSGSAAGNYTVTQPTGLTANITPLTVTVSGASANDKAYDGTTAATISGALLSGVLPADVGNVLATTGTFAQANVGTNIAVTILLTGSDAGNYTFTSPTLFADIAKGNQTITFGPLADKTVADVPFALTATASSGLTVTYTSSNPSVATVSGNIVTIVGVGSTIITAMQSGNANYFAAPNVTQTQLVIDPPTSIGTYAFTGSPGTLAPSNLNPNVNFTNMSLSTITQNSNVSNVFTGNPSSGTWGTAFSSTRYLQFTITPDAGFLLNIYSFDMQVFRSSAGATNYAVRSSIDGYANDLASGSVSTSATAIPTLVVSSPAFNNLTSITFRIYGWGGSSTGDFRLDNVTVNANVISTCTTPTQLAFQTQPVTSNQDVIIPFAIKATCSNGTTATGLNTGSVTVTTNGTGCGLQYNGNPVSSVTANFVNGVATFSNVTFSRSTQTGISLTTTNTQGLTNVTSNVFNINAPSGGSPVITTIVSEDFEGGSAWPYTVGTPIYGGSGSGVDVISIKTFNSNKSLCKSFSVNNASDEKKSTNTITFSNQTISPTYNNATFSFQLASLGTGTGAGVDGGDNLIVQISLNNGSTWNTLLTYFGNNDYLFSYATTPVTALAYNANAQYVSPSTKSKFSVTLPNGTTQFRFRVTATNNRTNENWAIDNLLLTGTTIPTNSPLALPTATGGTIATCPNTDNTLTVLTENTVGDVTYSWSPTTNMVPSIGDVSDPVVNPSVGTTYTVTITDADGCTASATQVITLPTGTAGLWTGNVNEDWFQCLNWGDGRIPTATTDVTIPNGVLNIAKIDPLSTFAAPYSGVAYTDDITINTGGELVGEYGSHLEVAGNWLNNGVFNPGDGVVIFNGSGISTINGTGLQQFNNLTVDTEVQLLQDAETGLYGALAVNQKLDLNQHAFTVNNPVNTAITQTSPGYVLSESQNGSARLLWNINNYSYTDNYIFPMGNSNGNYLPVTFKLNSGNIGLAGVSTYKSTGALAGNWPTGTENVLNVANPDEAVQRFWHLESNQTPNSYNADVTFSFPTSEDPTAGIGSDVKMQRYNKATDTWDLPILTQSYSPLATRSVTVNGITKFSWWGGGNENTNPLPVELLAFEANCDANGVTINWATATETNNDYFTVQRSANLDAFETVAIVEGAGNSNTYKYYSATDAQPLNGTSYYRLQQTDYNGVYEVFAPVAVTCGIRDNNMVSLYPNPANGQLNVNLSLANAAKGTIIIYNHLGQVVANHAIQPLKGANSYTYNVSALAAGQYFVNFLLDTNTLPVQKLVITQ